MTIKSVSSFLAGLFFVALSVALAPRPALALGDEVGKFTLPMEVHWGEVVLPPGDYSILAGAHDSSAMLCVYKKGSPMVGYFIPALERDSIPTSFQKTQLVLGEKGGWVYVKELQLGSEGLEFQYAMPKSKK